MRTNFTSVSVAVIALIAALSPTVATQQQAPPRIVQTPSATAPTPSCPELATAMTALMRNDVRLRDWPNLTRYRDANRSLPPVAAGEDRVVFMGDSITDAWPMYGDIFVTKPYVGRGISGQTTPQMLIRFRPDVIDLKPKVVVILAGTNDIAGNTGPMTDQEIQANLVSMSELAKANSIRVVLSSILPTSAYHTAPNVVPQTIQRPMSRIRSLNEWIQKYAASERHVYLDYFSAMVDSSGLLRAELSADDLHPNEKGYAVMGPLAEAAIQQALR